MTVSDQLANKIIDKVLRNINFTAAPVYISIHSGNPGITGASEFAGGGYSRQQVSTTGWNPAASRISDNVNTINFTNLSAGTASYVGLWDQPSAGNFLLGGPFVSPASVSLANGDALQFLPGRLDVIFI